MSTSWAVCRSAALSLALAAIWRIGSCHGRLGAGVVSLTEANFESFVHGQARLMVDFYKTDEEQTEFEKALRQVRDAGDSVPFAKLDATEHPEIAEKYVSTGKYPQLVWFQHGHLTKYHRTLRKADDISTFVLALDRDPITTVRSADDAAGINRAVFIHTKKASALYKEMEVVALKHMDMIAFLQLESPDEQVQWVAGDVVLDTYAGEPTAAGVERWVRSMLVESEEIPDQPIAEDGTTVVVGKTFEQIVLREDKDIFLMVYASWCGHCRKAFGNWTSFAREVADVEHLVIAKMDGSRNRLMHDNFTWTEYPTYFYVRAGEQAPSIFDGNRTLDGFLRFAKQHSTHPIAIEIDAPTVDPEIEL